MGLKESLSWIRTWGPVAQGGMSPGELARWVAQWLPFSARTVGYGAISVTLGPLTKDHRASVWAARRWSGSALRGLRLTAEIDGVEHVPHGRGDVRAVPAHGWVYASNHQSLLDILALGALLPGDFKWAAKRQLMDIPFLGWHLRLAGHVPVDRQAGKRAAAQVIHEFERVLAGGKALLVFPEGTRSEDGEIKDFKNGAFYAAVRAEAPVLPVAIHGTGNLMTKGAPRAETARERHIRVRIGAPIEAAREGSEQDRVVDLRDRTRAAVVAMFDAIRDA